jgi:hypothetical protein
MHSVTIGRTIENVKYLLILLFIASLARAEQAQRSKNLDFNGEVVEGVNRQSMDALESFSQKRRTQAKTKTFLYKERDSFQDENDASLRNLITGS